MFGFKSAKYDLNLIKTYLQLILVNERDFEPAVFQETNRFFFSLKLVDFQPLDTMSFFGGATSLDSILEAHKTSETKRFFPHEWFDQPAKMQHKNFSPYEVFYKKVRSRKPLEAKCTHYVNLLKSGLTRKHAVIKLKLLKPAP